MEHLGYGNAGLDPIGNRQPSGPWRSSLETRGDRALVCKMVMHMISKHIFLGNIKYGHEKAILSL